MPDTPHARPWYARLWLRWTAATLAIFAITAGLVVRHVIRNAEPILRKRIVETLSRRFNAPVDLDAVSISAANGLSVTGTGLRVYARPEQREAAVRSSEPETRGRILLNIQQFTFRTTVSALFHKEDRLGTVEASGVEIHIPPRTSRGQLLNPEPSQPGDSTKTPLTITDVALHDAHLFIDTDKPGKDPLSFNITRVELHDTLPNQPFRYDAVLTNPKPLGNIHAIGTFGPWNDSEPRETPITGDYTFTHADLNTIHGLGGILSSTGRFSGQLNQITVDGETDTPNFSLEVSEHPVPLHTRFHAIVDGTSGDTFLDPVRAHMLHSDFTARGLVDNIRGKGHDISLQVDMTSARIEDMLRLAVKTSPPLMHGALTMHTHLHIPPGNEPVSRKLGLKGRFTIAAVSFSNPQTQDKLDSFSARAQGHPDEASSAGNDRHDQVHSEMQADFMLGNGTATVTNLQYAMPGAKILLNGVYTLDGQVFEFKGHVRTDATASQMVTGWKSLLLKPVDPFLKKHGAGLELPVSISGTKSEPHFGLALNGSSDETPEQMLHDIRRQQQETAAIKAQARAALPAPRDGRPTSADAQIVESVPASHKR